MKCANCGNRTKGCFGICRTCKSALHNGAKQIKKEGLLLDTAGGSWWVWSPKGEVLVIGRTTREGAIIALIQDPV